MLPVTVLFDCPLHPRPIVDPETPGGPVLCNVCVSLRNCRSIVPRRMSPVTPTRFFRSFAFPLTFRGVSFLPVLIRFLGHVSEWRCHVRPSRRIVRTAEPFDDANGTAPRTPRERERQEEERRENHSVSFAPAISSPQRRAADPLTPASSHHSHVPTNFRRKVIADLQLVPEVVGRDVNCTTLSRGEPFAERTDKRGDRCTVCRRIFSNDWRRPVDRKFRRFPWNGGVRRRN